MILPPRDERNHWSIGSLPHLALNLDTKAGLQGPDRAEGTFDELYRCGRCVDVLRSESDRDRARLPSLRGQLQFVRNRCILKRTLNGWKMLLRRIDVSHSKDDLVGLGGEPLPAEFYLRISPRVPHYNARTIGEPWSPAAHVPCQVLHCKILVYDGTDGPQVELSQGDEHRDHDQHADSEVDQGIAEGEGPSNGSRLSCSALMKDSFPNLRAPPASSAC